MLHALIALLLVVGGIKMGVAGFKGDVNVMGHKVPVIFLIAVGAAALSVAFARDFYLPFLGETLMPCSVLEPKVPENADTEVKVLVKSGDKVLYWASEPANEGMETVKDWRHAYLGYKNAGVAVADDDGFATLKVRHPQPYTVPTMGKLDAHVHYRVCMHDGFIGPVKTVKLDGREMFEDYAPVMDPNADAAGITSDIYSTIAKRQAAQKVDRYGMPAEQLQEGFAPEENEEVPSAPFLYQKPENLAPTIAAYVDSTARRAQTMMIQTGAPDEGPEATNNAPFPATPSNVVEGFHGQPGQEGFHGQPGQEGFHGQPGQEGFHGQVRGKEGMQSIGCSRK